MTTAELMLSVDGVDALCADLGFLAQAAQRSLHVRKLLVDFFGGSGEVGCVDLEVCSATLAGQIRVEAKLCDRLAALAAAVRAGDFDGL